MRAPDLVSIEDVCIVLYKGRSEVSPMTLMDTWNITSVEDAKTHDVPQLNPVFIGQSYVALSDRLVFMMGEMGVPGAADEEEAARRDQEYNDDGSGIFSENYSHGALGAPSATRAHTEPCESGDMGAQVDEEAVEDIENDDIDAAPPTFGGGHSSAIAVKSMCLIFMY